MSEETIGVVKRDAVRAAGSCTLGAPGAAPASAPVGGGARIVRQSASGAVVEVTCRCGEKILLECTYPQGVGG